MGAKKPPFCHISVHYLNQFASKSPLHSSTDRSYIKLQKVQEKNRRKKKEKIAMDSTPPWSQSSNSPPETNRFFDLLLPPMPEVATVAIVGRATAPAVFARRRRRMGIMGFVGSLNLINGPPLIGLLGIIVPFAIYQISDNKKNIDLGWL